MKALPPADSIFTYNGHCFDLRHIRNQLGVDLRGMYESYDLRWICQRNGLTGGLKCVERQLGIVREYPDMDGRDAIRLWHRYVRGDKDALNLLLNYNKEDVMNLIKLREYLEEMKNFDS